MARNVRPSTLAPCVVCGKPWRKPNSNKCHECFNAAQRERYKRGDSLKPRRAEKIESFVAGEKGFPVDSNTIVKCYYCRPLRACIIALRRTDVLRWMKRNTGYLKEQYLVETVCRVSEIDVNLTNIDLSLYGWKDKGYKPRHKMDVNV